MFRLRGGGGRKGRRSLIAGGVVFGSSCLHGWKFWGNEVEVFSSGRRRWIVYYCGLIRFLAHAVLIGSGRSFYIFIENETVCGTMQWCNNR